MIFKSQESKYLAYNPFTVCNGTKKYRYLQIVFFVSPKSAQKNLQRFTTLEITNNSKVK